MSLNQLPMMQCTRLRETSAFCTNRWQSSGRTRPRGKPHFLLLWVKGHIVKGPGPATRGRLRPWIYPVTSDRAYRRSFVLTRASVCVSDPNDSENDTVGQIVHYIMKNEGKQTRL